MGTCPFCSAETRPGDNFCLNCGNRLTPANSSPQPGASDATMPAEENWMQAMPGYAHPEQPSPDANEARPDKTVVGAYPEPAPSHAELPTVRDVPAPTAQATMDTVENPAKFILRSDSGEVLQEYQLEKLETAIGRAPNSDILLSKDKLTSRRHATVRYENANYVLRDERSANGTFVNGQQLEEMVPRVLQDGDHVGIGEHELVFRSFGAPAMSGVEDLPTMAVQFDPTAVSPEMTYRTRDDELATAIGNDDFSTKSMDNGPSAVEQPNEPQMAPPEEVISMQPPMHSPDTSSAAEPYASPSFSPVPSGFDAPAVHSSVPPTSSPYEQSASSPASAIHPSAMSDAGVTFGRLTSLPLPTLPEIAPLMAALSTLDGQVMSLQQQLNASQDSIRNHDAEIAQTANQLRAGVRYVSDRMDSTIADVARRREELAWTDLIQLIEDVQNNPRDVEYLQKMARKARELNKIFQIHQNVLNTLAECTSLLRSLIGEDNK